MMSRDRDTGARVDALVRGAEWAQSGTSSPEGTLNTESIERVKSLYHAF